MKQNQKWIRQSKSLSVRFFPGLGFLIFFFFWLGQIQIFKNSLSWMRVKSIKLKFNDYLEHLKN